MTLRAKLLLAHLPLVGCLMVVGIFAVLTISRLGEISSHILKDNYRSVLAAQRMNESLERLNDAIFLQALGESEKAASLQSTHRNRFASELNIEEGNITEPGEAQASQTLRSNWLAYTKAYDALLLSREDMLRRYFQDLDPLFQELKTAVDSVLNINQDAMVLKSDNAKLASTHMNRLVAMASISAILVGIAASLWFTRKLLQPLHALWSAAQRVGQGNLDTHVAVTGQDEIANLATEFNDMADRLSQFRASSLGELLAAQESAQAAIDSLPDPVFILDIVGQVINQNQASGYLLRPSEEGGAKPLLSSLAPALLASVEHARAHVLSGKGPYVPRGFEESAAMPVNGQDRYFLTRAMPYYGASKNIAGVTVILQDITRLRRFDELKNDLMATVAHEYRTPLTSLHMAIHLCLEGAVGPLNDKQLDLLFAARKDCERLQAIVDDMLDLSRLQAGKVIIRLAPVAPQRLVDTSIAAHQEAARQRRISLESNVAPSLPEVMVDVERMGVVFSNLINNALMHTPAGGWVSVKAEASDSMVRFEVQDNGDGIAEKYLDRVFERFFRIPGASDQGAGLGLSIAQEIVQAHEGQIGVSSVLGNGSIFWFTLPTGSAQTKELFF